MISMSFVVDTEIEKACRVILDPMLLTTVYLKAKTIAVHSFESIDDLRKFVSQLKTNEHSFKLIVLIVRYPSKNLEISIKLVCVGTRILCTRVFIGNTLAPYHVLQTLVDLEPEPPVRIAIFDLDSITEIKELKENILYLLDLEDRIRSRYAV